MVTYAGDLIYLDNIGMGCMKNEEDPETVYLAFTDNDNEKTYLMPIHTSKIEQYFNLVKQTAAGQRIEIATADQMPKGAPRGA